MDTTTSSRMTPRDFFLSLGALIALYTSIPTLLGLIFTIIDKAYPRVESSYYYSPSISFPVATLIVMFPLFILFMWLLARTYRANPEKKNHPLRKWVIYITLFISGCILAGDLITVIYYYLDGQILTTGFILKVIATLIVAGGVFKYYILDLLGMMSPLWNKTSAILSLLFVLIVIIWGFSVIGSPATQRMDRYDSMKINDLQTIQSYVLRYWQQKGELPAKLEDLQDPLSNFSIPKDSQTGAQYGYEKVSPTAFRLCAAFNRGSQSGTYNNMPTPSYGYGNGPAINENWQHIAGGVCFDRTIDPTLYPPNPERPNR